MVTLGQLLAFCAGEPHGIKAIQLSHAGPVVTRAWLLSILPSAIWGKIPLFFVP